MDAPLAPAPVSNVSPVATSDEARFESGGDGRRESNGAPATVGGPTGPHVSAAGAEVTRDDELSRMMAELAGSLERKVLQLVEQRLEESQRITQDQFAAIIGAISHAKSLSPFLGTPTPPGDPAASEKPAPSRVPPRRLGEKAAGAAAPSRVAVGLVGDGPDSSAAGDATGSGEGEDFPEGFAAVDDAAVYAAPDGNEQRPAAAAHTSAQGPQARPSFAAVLAAGHARVSEDEGPGLLACDLEAALLGAAGASRDGAPRAATTSASPLVRTQGAQRGTGNTSPARPAGSASTSEVAATRLLERIQLPPRGQRFGPMSQAAAGGAAVHVTVQAPVFPAHPEMSRDAINPRGAGEFVLAWRSYVRRMAEFGELGVVHTATVFHALNRLWDNSLPHLLQVHGGLPSDDRDDPVTNDAALLGALMRFWRSDGMLESRLPPAMRRFDASASNDTLGEEVGRFVRKLDDLLTLSPPEDVNNPEFKMLVVELLSKPLASWLRQQAHAGTFTSYESDPLFKRHIGAGAAGSGAVLVSYLVLLRQLILPDTRAVLVKDSVALQAVLRRLPLHLPLH
jgi:hypothetical protein